MAGACQGSVSDLEPSVATCGVPFAPLILSQPFTSVTVKVEIPTISHVVFCIDSTVFLRIQSPSGGPSLLRCLWECQDFEIRVTNDLEDFIG